MIAKEIYGDAPSIGIEKNEADNESGAQLLAVTHFIEAIRECAPQSMAGKIELSAPINGYIRANLRELGVFTRMLFDESAPQGIEGVTFLSHDRLLILVIRSKYGFCPSDAFVKNAKISGFSVDSYTPELVISLALETEIWSKLYAQNKNIFIFYLKQRET